METKMSKLISGEIKGKDIPEYVLFSTRKKFELEGEIFLNERQRKALEYLKKYGKITNAEYRKLNPELLIKLFLEICR